MRVAASTLKQLIKERWGSIADGAHKCGFGQWYLDETLRARQRLGLQQMIILCGRLQVDVLPMLRGEVVRRTESLHIVRLSGQWLRKRTSERATRELIKEAISDDPAISIRRLCEQIEMARGTFRRCFSDIWRNLQASSPDGRRLAQWRRLLHRGRELRDARQYLAKAGVAFTKHNVYKHCSIYLRTHRRLFELFTRMQAKA